MPKIVDHEKYREEILNKCFLLFAQNGFQGVTMRQIGMELGISTGTLYHYFLSKEAIFRQMIIQLSQKQITVVTERFNQIKSFDEKIHALFLYVENNETFFQNVLFLIIDYYKQNGLQDPEYFIRDIANYYRKSIGEMIGLGDSPASGAIFTFCLGLVVQTMIDSGGAERVRILTLIKQMLDSFIGSIPTNLSQ